MSDERPSAPVLRKIEKALNAILSDDLAYIDGLQWRADIERVAGKLDRKLNRALSEAGINEVCATVNLNPARVTVQ
jgi:hypothetical protein